MGAHFPTLKLQLLLPIFTFFSFAVFAAAAAAKLHPVEGSCQINNTFFFSTFFHFQNLMGFQFEIWCFEIGLKDCLFCAVKALKDIGKRLGKKDWDFGVDPCSGKGNWRVLDERKGFESSVTCNCSFNHNSTCHVVSMYSSLSLSLSLLFPILLLIFLLSSLIIN